MFVNGASCTTATANARSPSASMNVANAAGAALSTMHGIEAAAPLQSAMPYSYDPSPASSSSLSAPSPTIDAAAAVAEANTVPPAGHVSDALASSPAPVPAPAPTSAPAPAPVPASAPEPTLSPVPLSQIDSELNDDANDARSPNVFTATTELAPSTTGAQEKLSNEENPATAKGSPDTSVQSRDNETQLLSASLSPHVDAINSNSVVLEKERGEIEPDVLQTKEQDSAEGTEKEVDRQNIDSSGRSFPPSSPAEERPELEKQQHQEEEQLPQDEQQQLHQQEMQQQEKREEQQQEMQHLPLITPVFLPANDPQMLAIPSSPASSSSSVSLASASVSSVSASVPAVILPGATPTHAPAPSTASASRARLPPAMMAYIDQFFKSETERAKAQFRARSSSIVGTLMSGLAATSTATSTDASGQGVQLATSPTPSTTSSTVSAVTVADVLSVTNDDNAAS